MIIGSQPSVYDGVELMFLLAWSYERKSLAFAAQGNADGAEAAASHADAGYQQVCVECYNLTCWLSSIKNEY